MSIMKRSNLATSRTNDASRKTCWMSPVRIISLILLTALIVMFNSYAIFLSDIGAENGSISTKVSLSQSDWCDQVAKARSTLDSSLHVRVPCEKMKPAKSAIVCYLTAGKPDGKGTRTVFTGSDYINGVMALGASLQDNLTRNDVHRLLLVNEGFPFPPEYEKKLESLGWIIGVAPHVHIDQQFLPGFARYKTVYNKVSAIGLSEYECVLLMDADTLTIGNIDSLMTCDIFDQPQYRVAGALDYYHKKWYHINTGSILWRTSSEEMNRVYGLTRDPSFMRKFESDQIFLNTVYPDRTNVQLNEQIMKGEQGAREKWGSIVHLPWKYNAQTHLEYQLPDYWTENSSDIRILHYTQRKGWQCPERYEPSNEKITNQSDIQCKQNPLCACHEGYRWYQYLKKANSLTS